MSSKADQIFSMDFLCDGYGNLEEKLEKLIVTRIIDNQNYISISGSDYEQIFKFQKEIIILTNILLLRYPKDYYSHNGLNPDLFNPTNIQEKWLPILADIIEVAVKNKAYEINSIAHTPDELTVTDMCNKISALSEEMQQYSKLLNRMYIYYIDDPKEKQKGENK